MSKLPSNVSLSIPIFWLSFFPSFMLTLLADYIDWVKGTESGLSQLI